jgi:uncharacterized protein YodC (DUF2158 family)
VSGFQPGDVVILKSGGPEMTVTNAEIQDAPGVVFCRWFDESGTPKGHRFAGAALKRIGDVATE